MPNPQFREDSNWELAFEHYQLDQVDVAHDLISQFGIGANALFLKHYRMIEAEATTRRKSVVQPITNWLSIEFIPEEVAGFGPMLGSIIRYSCDSISQRLAWDHGVPTRVTILAEETDAAWAAFPQGYCTSKDPYEKICLPNYLLDDQEEFRGAVAHEYAQVISGNLSQDHAPRWLEETISVLAEGAIDEAVLFDFKRNPSLWVSPAELETTFDSRCGDETAVEPVLRAYQQCGWIGRYLCSIAPTYKLRDLLEEHCNEGIVANLALQALGRGRVDGAFHKVYGMSVRRVFESAYKFVERY